MTTQPNAGAIVVVEDPFVASFLRSVLQRRGYCVRPVEPAECVDLLRSSECGVALLITNHPDAFIEFAERVPLLYLAAFPDPKVIASFRVSRALRKPFHPVQLLSCVEQLLQPM